MRKALFCAVLTGATLLALWPAAAQAGGGGGGPCAGFAEGAALAMRDNCFDGAAHFADAGGMLAIRNEGGLPHTYTAVDGSFDTGMLEPGAAVELPLPAEGIYRVYCTLHSSPAGGGMAGVLIVGNPSAAQAGAARPLAAVAFGGLGAAAGGGAALAILRRKPASAQADRQAPAIEQPDSPPA